MAERKEWQNGGSRSWPHNVSTRSFPLWEASMSCAYLINDPRWVELQLSTSSVLGDCFASQRPQLSSEIFFCGRRIWATTINGRWPLTFASKQSRAWSPSQPLLQWALLDPVYYDMPQRLINQSHGTIFPWDLVSKRPQSLNELAALVRTKNKTWMKEELTVLSLE